MFGTRFSNFNFYLNPHFQNKYLQNLYEISIFLWSKMTGSHFLLGWHIDIFYSWKYFSSIILSINCCVCLVVYRTACPGERTSVVWTTWKWENPLGKLLLFSLLTRSFDGCFKQIIPLQCVIFHKWIYMHIQSRHT